MEDSADHGRQIRLILIDDHCLFREALQTYLAREPDMEIVGGFEHGVEALKALSALEPDVVLVDIKMPALNGIEITRRILAQRPQTRVIILTVSEADEDLLEAFKAGARGYLLKGTTSGRELAQAIRRVARGEAIIPPALAPRLLAEFTTLARAQESTGDEHSSLQSQSAKQVSERQNVSVSSPRNSREHPGKEYLGLLTPRERQVLELVALGLTNREIAERLVISENTVRTHLRRILDKLHVHSRVEAAVWLKEHM